MQTFLIHPCGKRTEKYSSSCLFSKNFYSYFFLINDSLFAWIRFVFYLFVFKMIVFSDQVLNLRFCLCYSIFVFYSTFFSISTCQFLFLYSMSVVLRKSQTCCCFHWNFRDFSLSLLRYVFCLRTIRFLHFKAKFDFASYHSMTASYFSFWRLHLYKSTGSANKYKINLLFCFFD